MTEPAPSIRDRMIAAGIPDHIADRHLAAGTVRVNGQPARPDTPAPDGATYVIGPL